MMIVYVNMISFIISSEHQFFFFWIDQSIHTSYMNTSKKVMEEFFFF